MTDEELAELIALADGLPGPEAHPMVANLSAAVRNLAAQLRAAREVLARVEFSGFDGNVHHCPVCLADATGYLEPEGPGLPELARTGAHSPHCALAAVLGR